MIARIGVFVTALLIAASASAQPAFVDALKAAYPDRIAGAEGNELIWTDGTRMPISDGIEGKSFDDLLDHADIDDMFAQPYVPGRPSGAPGRDEDPGRIRNTAFFDKLYGDCSAHDFQAGLTAVRWVDGKSLKVSNANGLADHLRAVVADLAKLPKEFRPFLAPSAGTFNCRAIAGTDRRSMHAYAAAIDISTAHTNYWLWTRPVAGAYPYKNQVPFEIVEIFERHGFVWGGKWYHYDTMHFEYRPELFFAAGVTPAGY